MAKSVPLSRWVKFYGPRLYRKLQWLILQKPTDTMVDFDWPLLPQSRSLPLRQKYNGWPKKCLTTATSCCAPYNHSTYQKIKRDEQKKHTCYGTGAPIIFNSTMSQNIRTFSLNMNVQNILIFRAQVVRFFYWRSSLPRPQNLTSRYCKKYERAKPRWKNLMAYTQEVYDENHIQGWIELPSQK